MDPTMTEQVDLMEQVWSSLEELYGQLDPADWDRPSECPGWTLKDLVSHMGAIEVRLVTGGAPMLDAPKTAPHIRNELGASNEADVDERRRWAAVDVVNEWREAVARRLGELRAWGPEDWDLVTYAPVGDRKRRDSLRFRIFDAWVHEQDIRRVAGLPGHTDGAVARYCFDMERWMMPRVVAKHAQATPGQSVRFDVSGGAGAPFSVVVGDDGRGALADPGEEPTAALTMDFATFNALATGRWFAEECLADGRVKVSGDAALARAVLDNMNFVP